MKIGEVLKSKFVSEIEIVCTASRNRYSVIDDDTHLIKCVFICVDFK